MSSYIVIDIEATGNHNVTNTRIIEMAFVLIEKTEITFQYSTLINPQTSIPPFITSLTGISNEDVKHAPTFSDVAQKVKSIIDEHTIVGHNVLFDVRFLNKEFILNEMNQLTNKTIDTVELSKILFPTLSHFKLNELATYFNLTHMSPHRALSDAIVTSELFLKLNKKLCQLPLQTKKQLINLTDKFHSDLDNMLQQAERHLINESNYITYSGLTFNNFLNDFQKEKPIVEEAYGHFIDNIYGQNGTLVNEFPQYEHRAGQQDISADIYDAFRLKNHALIEAATGTGKTLAYLIPALYKAVKNDETIIVSTEKVNLQLQLINKDLPALKKVIPFPFTYTSLKGKSHYLNLAKFHKQLSINENNYNKNMSKAMILIWLTETITGDLNELNLPEGTTNYIKNMSAIKEQKNSPWFQYSYYNYAYKKAENSHIVIVNHALLSTDIHLKANLLPKYSKIIIDEAHHFPDIAEKQLSLLIDFKYVFNFVKKLQLTTGLDSHCKELLSSLKYTIHELYRYIFQLLNNKNYPNQTVIVNDLTDKTIWLSLVDMINRIVLLMKQIINYNKFKNQSYILDDLNILEEMKNLFTKLSKRTIINDTIVSFEYKNYSHEHNIYLYAEQTNTALHLAKNLFNKKDTVILTSATLTVNRSFSYIINRLGLNPFHLIKQIYKSPYNIKKQAKLMIPNDFPSINNDNFVYVVTEAIFSLIHVLKRNILVLFTSHKMLKSVYYLLDELNGLQYNLIAQNITHRNNVDLLNEFKKVNNCILLGTASLWEGIDVSKNSLSCLIIVKLPFDNPNDIKHKMQQSELEKRGKNSFYHYTLPRMIIRLKQGIGRLIRSKKDKGVIFVFDDRIYNASYSNDVLSSIHKYPPIYDSTKSLIEETERWLK